MLKQHIQSSNYTTVQRAKFHNLMRNKGESFRSFMLRLQQQASKCNFNADLPTQLRDRIVAGVQDKEVTKRLLREGDALTYAAARKILEDWDQVNDAVEVTTHLRDSEVLYTKHKQHYTQRKNTGVRHRDLPSSSKNTNKPSGNDQGASQSYGLRLQRKCNSCGGDHPRYTCRFRKVVCHNCRKKGHIRSVCRSNPNQRIKFVKEEEDSADETTVVFTTNLEATHLTKEFIFDNGYRQQFLIDTGSPVTLIPSSILPSAGFKENQIVPCTTRIKGISGRSLTTVGQIQTTLRNPQDGSQGQVQMIVREYTRHPGSRWSPFSTSTIQLQRQFRFEYSLTLRHTSGSTRFV